MKKCPVCTIVTFLSGVGALNWGLIAIARLNLVARFLGDMTRAAKVVYLLIGIAGLMAIISILIPCPCCKKPAKG